jgi:hypothetical protein
VEIEYTTLLSSLLVQLERIRKSFDGKEVISDLT